MIYFHVVISLFLIIVSVYTSDILFNEVSEVDFINNIGFVAENSNPGIAYFFKNNVLFFLLVSLTPFVNVILFVLQFINLGTTIQSIMNLSFENQFIFLYRHLFFEVIALFTAIIISYKLFGYGKDLLNDRKVDWNKRCKKILILYMILVISTLLGAILEGTVSVAI